MSARRAALLVTVTVLAGGSLAPRVARASDDIDPPDTDWWYARRGTGCEYLAIEAWDPHFDGASTVFLMNDQSSGVLIRVEQTGEALVGKIPPGTPGLRDGAEVSLSARFVDSDTLEVDWSVDGQAETVRYSRKPCSEGSGDDPGPPTESEAEPLPEAAILEPRRDVVDDFTLYFGGRPTPGEEGDETTDRETPSVTPPAPEPGGQLVGTVTVLPNKHEQGGGSSHFSTKNSEDSVEWERVIPHEDYEYAVRWTFDGVPPSLRPGEEYHIAVTWEITKESQPGRGAGEAMGGNVAISGDVDVLGAQASDRVHKVGRFKFRVRPNARKVEIHLGGAPFDTFAIWKYERK